MKEAKIIEAILVKARELIANPKYWMKKYYCAEVGAEDKGLDPLTTTVTPEKLRFCGIGAVQMASRLLGAPLLCHRVEVLLDYHAGGCMIKCNDKEGHDAVLKVYDSAIAHVRTEA